MNAVKIQMAAGNTALTQLDLTYADVILDTGLTQMDTLVTVRVLQLYL